MEPRRSAFYNRLFQRTYIGGRYPPSEEAVFTFWKRVMSAHGLVRIWALFGSAFARTGSEGGAVSREESADAGAGAGHDSEARSVRRGGWLHILHNQLC